MRCYSASREDASECPSEIETDPIMELLMPQDEGFKDAEERRLFYVALTRAKRQCFRPRQLEHCRRGSLRSCFWNKSSMAYWP